MVINILWKQEYTENRNGHKDKYQALWLAVSREKTCLWYHFFLTSIARLIQQ